jgi:DNA-binding MarR family transcriptional regulator|tara:strand:- start:292 stop:492 length:201 start_codon:yes stop_codon:yes gene_type:complete
MKFNQSHFEILRKISKTPDHTQRELANTLGYSLGKLNYCLNSLKQKGLVKINNFKESKKKLNMFIS